MQQSVRLRFLYMYTYVYAVVYMYMPSYTFMYFSVSQLHRFSSCEGLALQYEKAPGT